MDGDHPDRVYMAEIESELRRDRSTIRTWEDKGWLPSDLEFYRDERGWRYWTRDQVAAAKEWVQSRRRQPSAYSGNNPRNSQQTVA